MAAMRAERFYRFAGAGIDFEIDLKVLPERRITCVVARAHPWFAGLLTGGGRRSARRTMPISTPIRNSTAAGTTQ
jgi:hypothetical protein